MGSEATRIRILGPITVEGARTTEPLGPRLRRLLARLVIADGVVSDSELIEAIWPAGDELPENPTRSLRTYVSRLRSQLGPDAVERLTSGYRLSRNEPWIDLDELGERLSEADEAGRRADDRTAIARLEEALALWSGSVLGEFATEPWSAGEAHRLDELRIQTRERRADLLIGLGDTGGSLLADLEGLVAEFPRREEPTRLLMLALHDQGRQADAVTAFSRLRNQLATDLGLDPSEDLRRLEEQILTNNVTPQPTGGRRRSLRGYEIRERLGEGAFSIVYRGSQQSIDREVAVKQIRAELANRPEFIRRFEAEAHLVARLEHPHIVPLIDYWREPDSAYLVMRLLRAGSLESNLRSGPWDLERAVEMVVQIGSALSIAHRVGVVHRDVKPANILLDDEGNAYLTDFGIALEASEAADPDAALSAGSPAYASPEQLRREPVGPSADVHGLAITTYEALTAQVPFPDEPSHAALLQRQLHDPIPPVHSARPDLPRALDGVLARATEKDPARRFQTIDEFVVALREAVGDDGADLGRVGIGTVISGSERNPYKGLRAFDEADTADFAGRARLVDQLVQGLTDNRLLAVVGPSGSGKSSAVRAGLLPAVRRGIVPGSSDWFVTTLLPGANPFEELETALLRVAAERPSDLLSVLTDGPRGIARAVRHAVPDDRAQVLLVIDQFEELFTQADNTEAGRFLDALALAVTEERSRLRVVLTLRADFYDRPLRHEALGRLVRDATVAVLPLAPDELEHAVVDPAQAVGAEFEPGLVSEIVADVADQPGALPLLQYALTELYEARVSGLMTRDAYRRLGGVAGALGRRAEEVYQGSTDDERIATRRIFGRLVSLGEGTEDTRRRALRSELGDGGTSRRVIEAFGSARLLSFDRDPTTRESTVEVAHEALLREWPRLRSWLDEDREGLRVLRHLSTAAWEWDNAGRTVAELYRGGRLEAAEEYAGRTGSELTARERSFVEAGVARRQHEEDEERRVSRRLRRLLSGVAVVAVIALIAGVVAFQQRGQANDQRLAAERARFAADTGSLAAEAAARAGEDPQLALLLAAEAYRRAPGPESLGALQRVLTRTGPYLGVLGAGRAYHEVEWHGDGTITGIGPGGVSVFSVGGELVADEPTPVADVVFFVGDGTTQTTTLAAAGAGVAAYVPRDARSELHLLDARSGKVTVLTQSSEIRAVEVTEDGRTVFVMEDAGPISAIETATGDLLWQAAGHPEVTGLDLAELDVTGHVSISGQTGPFASQEALLAQPLSRRPSKLALSGDGSTLVSAEAVIVRRWRTSDGTRIGDDEFPYTTVDDGSPSMAAIDELAVDERGRWFSYVWRHVVFAQAFGDGAARHRSVVETAGGVYGRPKPDSLVWDESMTAWTVLTDGRVARLDLTDGSIVGDAIAVPFDGVFDVGPSPDGRSVAVASNEGIAVVAVDGDRLLAEAVPRNGMNVATVNPELDQILLGSAQMPTFDWERGRFYDMGADSPSELDHAGLDDFGMFWSRDFKQLASMTLTYEMSRWDLQTDERLITYDMPGSWLSHYFSPDGRYVAIADHLGVEVLDVVTGDQIVVLDDVGPYPSSVSFSDDRLAAAALSGATAVWEVDAWEPGPSADEPMRWRRVDDGELEGVTSLRYSPDGRLLATVAANGTIDIRDARTLDVEAQLAAELEYAGQNVFGFGSEGDQLLVNGRDNTELWDIASGRRIGDPFPNDPDFWAAPVDGPHLATAVGPWALRWNLRTEEWFDIACRAAGRNLTPSEWARFGPQGAPYERTCEQWPAVTSVAGGEVLDEDTVGRSVSQTQEGRD